MSHAEYLTYRLCYHDLILVDDLRLEVFVCMHACVCVCVRMYVFVCVCCVYACMCVETTALIICNHVCPSLQEYLTR